MAPSSDPSLATCVDAGLSAAPSAHDGPQSTLGDAQSERAPTALDAPLAPGTHEQPLTSPEGATPDLTPPSAELKTSADRSPTRAPRTPATTAAAPAKPDAGVSPVMAQYVEIKSANPDCLLFFRMGDFYELFFEDAKTAASALNIHQTTRGKFRGEPIPMAGVPVDRGDEYLARLIRQGYRVAVCEQVESPEEAKKRGSKSVVKRDIVRIVTPGTLTDDDLIDPVSNNFMSAIWLEQSASGKDNAAGGAIASIDLSTGEVRLGAAPLAELVSELERLAPREVLLPDETRQRSMAAPGETAGTAALEMIASTCAALGALQTPVAAVQFDARRGGESLCRQYDVREVDSLADAGRPFDDGELAAMHAALSYISLTQVGRTPQLRRPVRISGEGNLVIDAATRRNLELERTAQGDKMGSLLWAIDRTVTPAGGRAMAAVLREPLCNQAAIIDRLDAVEFLLREAGIRDDVRTALRGLPDVARALSRLALQRGAPRDLGQLRAALRQARTVGALFAERAAGDPASTPDQIARAAGPCTWLSAPPSNEAHPVAELLRQLDEALNETLPAARRDGNFIRPGHNSELDELRSMRDDARQVIATLETRYRDQSAVKSLKIKYNNQLGYFIEVTPAHAQTMLGADPAFGFQHRQTLVSAVRFMTEELASLEGRITAASERALTLEGELFNALVAQALTVAEHLTKLADGLAALDVFAGLAQVAHEENYIRPHIDNGASLEISLGRHPVVEQAMRRGKLKTSSGSREFIANDLMLGARDQTGPADGKPGADRDGVVTDDAAILIMTGPNMAGKSTYLRQNALIILLAQIGSFVPATSARIGLVDRLFSRVGASDDLARGRSTFMVEMVETAAILNGATARSFVILDEIGRGTATYDGLSLAWSTIEFLHDAVQCRALFATHYHELTALSKVLPRVRNATVGVREWRDEIVFLHQVIAGAADRSYGIQVAKLAGLPKVVIDRAGEILTSLETSHTRPSPEQLLADLPLFAGQLGPEPAAGAANTGAKNKGRGNGRVRKQAANPAAAASVSAGDTALASALAALDPDAMSPREALDALYALKAQLRAE